MNIPALRFKEFNDEWQSEKLNKVVKRVTRKNKNLESTLPLTISAQYGLINQTKFFNKQIASDKLENYFLLKKGEFAYNKSYSKDAPWGAIKRLNNYDNGVLSTLYILFKPTNIDSDFLQYFFNSSKWYKNISQIATEGARNHGLLNVSPIDFFNTKIKIPLSLDEQEKIGTFFTKIDHLIALHEQKLALLNKKKQGYLQKLFPQNNAKIPQLRFKGFNDEWQNKKIKDIAKSFSGGTPKVGIKEYYEGNIPFIRSAEINSLTTELFISQKGLDNSSAKLINKGDILYALYGATSGEVGIAKIKGAINQAILCIKPINSIDKYFLATYLKKDKNKFIVKYLQGGQGNLSAKIVNNYLLHFPCYKEQQKIGSFFSKLDHLIELQEHKLELLKQKKQAYLQRMFV